MSRVLFVHGLEANERGIKVTTLKQCPTFDVDCPRMPCTKNIWQSFGIVVREIRLFRPDIIVASSYGTILTLLAIQLGVWSGRTMLLATAMAVANPSRLYVPQSMIKNLVVVHGTRDRTCPIDPIRQWTTSAGINFIELDDKHPLKSITNDPALLPQLVLRQISQTVVDNTIDDAKSLLFMQIKLVPIVFFAALSYIWRNIKR